MSPILCVGQDFSVMFVFLFGTICGFRRVHYSWFEQLESVPERLLTLKLVLFMVLTFLKGY